MTVTNNEDELSSILRDLFIAGVEQGVDQALTGKSEHASVPRDKAKSALQTLITKSVLAKLKAIMLAWGGDMSWEAADSIRSQIAELEQSLNRKEQQ